MADNEVLTKTITVTTAEGSYEFNIPSLFDEIRVGARVSELRKKADPNWNGFDQGLDTWTAIYLRTCAVYEILLTKGPRWVWTENRDATVKTATFVDSTKFPPEKFAEATGVYLQFQDRLTFFRENGTLDQVSPGTEAVASQPGS